MTDEQGKPTSRRWLIDELRPRRDTVELGWGDDDVQPFPIKGPGDMSLDDMALVARYQERQQAIEAKAIEEVTADEILEFTVVGRSALRSIFWTDPETPGPSEELIGALPADILREVMDHFLERMETRNKLRAAAEMEKLDKQAQEIKGARSSRSTRTTRTRS